MSWILLVEDNQGDVDLIRLSLNEHVPQCRLEVLSDGDSAFKFLDQLDAAEAPCPSLVVLDLNLPKKSGREVLARLRRSPSCGSVPVVVFSSSEAAKDKDDVIQLGADYYITKPSTLDSFLGVGALLKLFMKIH